MSPQQSSPPELFRCADVPVSTRSSSECILIHHKTPMINEYMSRNCGHICSRHMKSISGEAAHVQILFSSVCAPLSSDVSSPTVGGYASDIKSCESCRTRCTYTHSPSKRVRATLELNRMQELMDATNAQRSFIFIQSNRKKRLPYQPLRATSKTSIPSGRKQFLNNFFRVETHVRKLVSARMQGPVNNNKVPK